MGHVQIDAPYLLVGVEDHDDFLRSLPEIDVAAAEEMKAGTPAGLQKAGAESDLAGQHSSLSFFMISLAHDFRLGLAKIADRKRRSACPA